jgi:hypothetical protein
MYNITKAPLNTSNIIKTYSSPFSNHQSSKHTGTTHSQQDNHVSLIYATYLILGVCILLRVLYLCYTDHCPTKSHYEYKTFPMFYFETFQ